MKLTAPWAQVANSKTSRSLVISGDGSTFSLDSTAPRTARMGARQSRQLCKAIAPRVASTACYADATRSKH